MSKNKTHFQKYKKTIENLYGKNVKKSNINRQFDDYKKKRKKVFFDTFDNTLTYPKTDEANVAIIIPYRNREEHLEGLKKHFQNTKFDIYVIEQFDQQRFNRGILLNIGFDIASKKKNYDLYIFHDVDSLPDEDLLNFYTYKGDKIIHYASPFLGYKYKYPTFLGGVIGMSGENYMKINGFPNRVFGWGGEDDILYDRLAKNHLKIYRPKKGKYFLYEHDVPSKNQINPSKWEAILRDLKEWKKDGVKQIKSHYILITETHTENPSLYLCKVKIPYYHKKEMIYQSLMEPLIEWNEIKRNIIETYTQPRSFQEKVKIPSEIEKLMDTKIDSEYEKGLTLTDLEKTLRFIFDVYREVLYFRIRQNGIEFAYHIYNKNFKNRWSSYIQMKNQMTPQEFLKKKNENLQGERSNLLPNDEWTGNNCVISLEDWKESGNPTEYVKEYYEMIMNTIKHYKNVPDCDILINRKDFQYLDSDRLRYAYRHLFPENVKIPDSPNRFWIIGCGSSTLHNKDVPIPNSNEWTDLHSPVQKIDWKEKEDSIIFRGQSTGCGLTEETNPRLRLSQIAHLTQKPSVYNIGLSKFIKRVKVNNFIANYIDLKKYNHLIKDFILPKDQMKSKYMLNIEGNVAAYRFPGLFRMGSVVVQTESEYYLWFEPLLKDEKNYLLLKKDIYQKEGDSIEESTKKVQSFFEEKMKKDSKMKKIAENGLEFYQKHLQEENIYQYYFSFMKKINSYYK